MLNLNLSNIPNIYGKGTIFAFSGLDGLTNVASEFVATFTDEPYGLVFHTPTQRILNVTLPDTTDSKTAVATGDVLWVTHNRSISTRMV